MDYFLKTSSQQEEVEEVYDTSHAISVYLFLGEAIQKTLNSKVEIGFC